MERKNTRQRQYSMMKSHGKGAYREMVQKRAYDLFVKRGHAHGNDLADWLEAERQIKHEMQPHLTAGAGAGERDIEQRNARSSVKL